MAKDDNDARSAVAILVDAENFAAACGSLKTTFTEALGQIKFAIVSLGNVVRATVYASKPLKFERHLRQSGYNMAIAKSVDMTLAVESVALLNHEPNIDAFVLVSGDSDLIPVAKTLRRAGKYVVIIAARQHSKMELIQAADVFIPLEDIIRGKAMTEVLSGRPRILPRNSGPPLKAFLCHSSGDKVVVRVLYQRLSLEGFDPWLDEEKLVPGQDWEREISAAVRSSGVVIVCLSSGSITKEGFVQKEIKYALDVADEKPEGTIFIVPLRLEECAVPTRLTKWHWVDYFKEQGYTQLVKALRLRQKSIDPAP